MSIASDRRRAVVAAGAALLLALSLFAPGVIVPQDDGAAGSQRGPTDVKLVEVRDNSSAALWPYTSRRHDYSSLTLPINVVVRARATRVRYVLAYQTDAQWNETKGEWTGLGPEDATVSGEQWGSARGSTRYTYVYAPEGAQNLQSGDPGDESVGWMDETYQLHDGSYFGSRHHVRMYAGGSGEKSWTAVQAHKEHWDWFRLRHTVGSLAGSQKYVEEQFRGEYFTDDITRRWYANGGVIDADGWVTVIELRDWSSYAADVAVDRDVGFEDASASRRERAGDAPLDGVRYPASAALVALAVGLTASGMVTRRRFRTAHSGVDSGESGHLVRSLDRELRKLVTIRAAGNLRRTLLFLAPVLITGFVRFGSIAVEESFPGLSPKAIAAVFYLFLAISLPVSAYALSKSLTAEEAFALALLGLGTGQIVDYTAIGVSVLPINVIVHRVVLVAALGFVAAGGAREVPGESGWSDELVFGVACWLFALGWPLLSSL